MVVGLRRSIVSCGTVGREMEERWISYGEGGSKCVELWGRPWRKLELVLGPAFSGRPEPPLSLGLSNRVPIRCPRT